MGIRLTGLSTSVGGLSREYTGKEKSLSQFPTVSGRKIRVFISSICGQEKYDSIRAKLGKSITDTQLAEVYMFETEGASTLQTGNHYKWALEDSDVCIFLIDNADGVPPGVQAEIDTVKKYSIKALYYFCDEQCKEMTAVQKSLLGAQHAKHKTVHTFSELSQNGARELINDIISVYHYYCKGKLIEASENLSEEFQEMNVAGLENLLAPTMPKTLLNNVDKCTAYISKLITGYSYDGFWDDEERTCEIDDWGVQFLPILFEGKSIKQFNLGMFLETLKDLQTEAHYQIIQSRWKAIQLYFSNDIAKCVEVLENTRMLSEETQQPTWLKKDILIDLRNKQLLLNSIQNKFTISEVQRTLTESEEELYYPVMDRLNESLHEKYLQGLYKKKTESPYTITYSNEPEQFCRMLASMFVVAMYNGSLTYLLLLYERIKDLLFYLSNKYDDYEYKRDLLKMAIFGGKSKEVKGLQDAYPEILNKMDAGDALTIMTFCSNHPVKHKRFISQLLALGSVGYYLCDKDFEKYKEILLDGINEWLSEETPVLSIAQYIFQCLDGIAYRLPQDTIGEICCAFIDKHFSRWYMDIFKLIARRIDICKMSPAAAKKLINHIICVLDNDSEYRLAQNSSRFLCVLRKQSEALTAELDQKVAEVLPQFYESTYKLETTTQKDKELPAFVHRYIKIVASNNETQGKDGYASYGTRYIATIRAIFEQNDLQYEDMLMDNVVSTVADTLLVSKEDIQTKLDAIDLLICIAVKYPHVRNRNQVIYDQLKSSQQQIEEAEHSLLESNIDSISLKIGLQLLYAVLGTDTYASLVSLIPYIHGNNATTLSVERMIANFYDLGEHVNLPERIELLILQNVMQWLQSEYMDIRWYATKLLFKMLRNPINRDIVNNQLIHLIDSENYYIKNLILRNILKVDGIADGTKEYILRKCECDTNFAVRLMYSEIRCI